MPSTTVWPAPIYAVIVLYKRSPDASEAFSSLLDVAAERPDLVARLSLILYDNSPEPHRSPPGQIAATPYPFPVQYIHDPANSGLAGAYNFALARAEENHAPWLLLLDQDTAITVEYCTEMLMWIEAFVDDTTIAAIVPKLVVEERIYSPRKNFLYDLRHQWPRMRDYPVSAETSGVQTELFDAYNSGAVIRISALRSIGGFPAEFWLDYLDHAVFHAFEARGFRLCVMRASLVQKLSHLDLNDVPLWRHRSVLESQTLFVQRVGKPLDRWMYRFWLLRQSRQYRRLCQDRRVWRSMALQALLQRIPRNLTGSSRQGSARS